MTLRQVLGELSVSTRGKGFVDATTELSDWLHGEGAQDGLLTVFLRHTSASLVIQENTDPDVLADLGDALSRLAPENAGYRHGAEGPDDMPAHIRTALTGVQVAIPVSRGRLALGTWQAVYVAEHRSTSHRRRLALHYLGT